MARIGLEKIEKYLFDSANFLRGHIDAGDYKQFIFPLLFFKRVCDVYDEEYAKNEAEFGVDFEDLHMFNVPKEHHWNVVREKSEDVGQALQTAMREIEKAKISCAKKLFNELSTSKVKYHDVNNYQELLNVMNKV